MRPESTIQCQRTFTFPAKGMAMIARSPRGATGFPDPALPPALSFIGVDVSKSWIDIADTAGRHARVANTAAAITGALTGAWSRGRCASMVCEATGGLF